MKTPILTIYIVHYRKIDKLKKTIESIKKNTFCKYKIRILNQGFINNEIAEYLNQLQKESNITIIFKEKNIGCAPGRYILARNIETPFVLSLDDDMYVGKDWFKEPYKFFQDNPAVMGIGFMIKENNKIRVGGEMLQIDKRNKIVCINSPVIPQTLTQRFFPVDDICAGAILYRRELKNSFTWDKNYFIAFDDLDKGLQLKQNLQLKFYIDTKNIFVHDKVSIQKGYELYNKSRRNYKQIRKSYIHFRKKWGLRMPLRQHFFYLYLSLLPISITRNLAYIWLRYFKRVRSYKIKNG